MKGIVFGVALVILLFLSCAQSDTTCDCSCSLSSKKKPPLPTEGCNHTDAITEEEEEDDDDDDTESDYKRPIDCLDIQRHDVASETGLYTIFLKKKPVRVRCDMATDGGSWTVIQRRINDSDFYKTWDEYQTGFGDLDTNFWLGNQHIHLLTSQGWYELRIDMKGPDGKVIFAQYGLFEIASGFDKYRLLVGDYSGDAGDSLNDHNGAPFSTKDSDNDNNGFASCATTYVGAWWYNKCLESNLNGLYGSTAYGKGIVWYSHTTMLKSLITVEMKVRRSLGHVGGGVPSSPDIPYSTYFP